MSAISNALLDVAATFKASATHVATAESLTIKAIKATASGETRLAPLHLANAERAFGAAIDDARSAARQVGQLSVFHPDTRAVRTASEQAIGALREADEVVYTEGVGGLTQATSYFNNTPTSFARNTNATEFLNDAAGFIHARAVLPST